ncbi:hypothetical protein FRC10_011942 [Ceratobasidium sp. 414]|nr:hypothetical protein FRC10_011942 [Ceratobasidium sp. 414]
MPRCATLLRPAGHLTNNRDGRDPGQPRPTFPCLHCSRMFYSEADRTRHIALRLNCRKGEELLERMELASNAEFQSIFDALVSALEEIKDQLGGESEAEGEAMGMDEGAGEPEAGAEMEEGLEAETKGPEPEREELEVAMEGPGVKPTEVGAPASAGCTGSDVEATVLPQHEHVPTATHKERPPQGASKRRRHLLFDKRENAFVEHFPDRRASAPINDKTAPAPNLNEYMAATGNLGIPRHLDTAELLLTTGLTADGRDEHLRSHLYVGNTPWKSNRELMEDLDKLPRGPGWEVYEIVTKMAGQTNKKSYLFTRNIVDVVLDIMANLAFKDYMHYTPQRLWTTADRQSRVYSNPWTANWWWRTQMRIPDKSATVVPLIIATDRTRLSVMSGGQEAYPVYISVGNIDKSVRRKSTLHAMVLLAYLPVDDFENAENPDEKARLKNELTHRAMEMVTKPLQTASRDGVVMQCADGRFRHSYPIVAGVIGDWPEQCMMACTLQSGCPKCVQKEEGRGDYRRHARPRNNRETLEALSRYFKTGDLGELDALGLKPWWPWWANLPYVDFSASLMPDILHQLHQGMVKTHLVRWTRKLVGKRQVDHCFMAMPKAEGMRHFTEGISKLKGQWTGRESREVAKQLLPVSVGQPISFIQQTPTGHKTTTKQLDPDFAGLTRAILEFSYRSHASRMTDEDVGQLEKALEEIHQFKDVIVRTGLFEDHSRFDGIPKLHMLSHYAECIREMGTPDNYSTEAPEHLHIECAKRGWRASNKVRPTPQMVKFIQRYEALRIQRAHMNAWLGAEGTNKWRKRKRKSRVVYGEDVEGPGFRDYGVQSADMAGADKEEAVEDREAEELERQEEEDEVAEGLQVQLEKHGRPGAGADEHVVYPDPTLSIAINPNAGRMKGLDIIAKHGATDFIQALHTFLKKNTTRQSLPDFFLPTVHHCFRVWNRLYLHHRPLPFDPEHAKRDVIRARPETHYLGSAFDVALLLHRKEAFGLDRTY